MSEYAVLGPVDPQLGQYPGASILKAVERKPVAELDDQTLIMADQAEKAIVQGTWTHDHPITFERAKSFGLPVRSDIPADFLDLMSLYPQPVRHQPTVEYLPIPRRLRDVPPQQG
jgi:hypothetical protein